jgi:hypothetical protein
MLLNYAIEAQMLGYLGLKVNYSDSGNAYFSVYGVDTAKTALRSEIALRELLSNKVNDFSSPNSTTYPTTTAVNTLVSSYKLKSDSVANDGYTRRDRTQHIADSVAGLIPSVTGKLNISDTAAMLTPYLRKADSNFNGGYESYKHAAITYQPIGSYVAATTTSINTVPIVSGIDNTVTASALTLTTTTLNPTVVTSSLTSVGTIGSGTWSSTIGSAATGSTQAINNNSTQIATTAYVDRYQPTDTSISAAYTLTTRDFRRTIHCTNGSNIALTVPTGLGTTFICVVIQEGAGSVTPTASSTTLTMIPTATTKTKQVGSAIVIRSWATANTFTVQGDMN